jgi:D-alanyl-D-alanine carboxypeptidase/D-alanyl-D-alanine-endopeptidase (penicillin-binding protein 4)
LKSILRSLGRTAAAFALLAPAVPAGAQSPGASAQNLQQRVEARFAALGPGPRFGFVVAGEDGRELVAIAPEGRFIPASNTKMFTTAAAFALLPDLDQPDPAGAAAVHLENTPTGQNVVLEGRGDPRLSSAGDCVVVCLARLADAVAAKTKRITDVVGDDSLFPDERWSPGMSWNNIVTRSGTAVSALILDDNEIALKIVPGPPGQEPRLDAPDYYEVDNRALTVASGPTALRFDRLPGSRHMTLTGTIAATAEPEILRLGIDDPAHYAAWRFKALLEARGVKVGGRVLVRHRPLGPEDDPALREAALLPRPQKDPLARLGAPPLGEDLVRINKVSQNLHAELMLRRVGRRLGSGSIADGLAGVRAMLERAGVGRRQFDFSDGSGMSTYNRVSPRGVVTLLRWAATQPWGVAWRATMPVAGVDGTLARRFRGTPLEGRLFAKTGSLNASYALSGSLIARSGRTLFFSAFANDVPEGVAATSAIDSALELVAEAN